MEKSKSFPEYSSSYSGEFGFHDRSNSYTFNGPSTKGDGFATSNDPELKRKKRIASYNMFTTEDMSTGQPEFTSPEQDSCTSFSFEESSTSPLMEDIDKDGIDVGDISDDERNNGNDEGNNENMGNEKNDTQNEDANPHKHAFQRKPRKRTSTIWNDFEEVVDTNGSKKVKCNYCLTKFNMPSTGATTQFHRHLKRCTQRQLAIKKQMVLSVETVASDCAGSIANFKYDRAKLRDLASHMTLYHEYPFMQMEDVIFNKFMRANTLYWQKITRIAIKNDFISTYEIEKKKLKTLFKSINKVNITTDIRKSSNQKIGYMVVTGHFIDSDWKLQKRVLNFFHMPPPHNGVIVPDALQKCFIEWGIEDKFSKITVDNAKDNDIALKVLKDNFTLKKKLSFDGRIFHVRCCAHIINLLVQDGIKEVKEIYPEAEANKNIAILKQALYEIYNETIDTIQPSKSDLDIDLDKSAFICAEGSANNFDIMEWWKENTLKFHILSKMARKNIVNSHYISGFRVYF
ncbi:hypothetical protein F0562_002666 [Nyssa sinensis]|uniref:BED-type domain-containing protein n=1 Tax=Nyssa sinensis TaxID=561372 RepID=A0A5J5BU90_9ASTE|nr:hypothetical protein F0562_002666 [Nyssa sinensis]